MMERMIAVKTLIEAGRWIAEKGMTWGSAGNMSIRLNEEEMLITASGSSFGALSEDSFTLYQIHSGQWSGGKPSKELPVHLAVYRQSPWAGAVLHASPFHTTLAASTDLCVRNDLFVENMYYLQRMASIRYEHPGSDALAQAVAEVAAQANVILMKNHGVILYDQSIEEARQGLEVLENTCRMCLEARRAGIVFDPVAPERVRDFLENSGYRKPRLWPSPD